MRDVVPKMMSVTSLEILVRANSTKTLTLVKSSAEKTGLRVKARTQGPASADVKEEVRCDSKNCDFEMGLLLADGKTGGRA